MRIEIRNRKIRGQVELIPVSMNLYRNESLDHLKRVRRRSIFFHDEPTVNISLGQRSTKHIDNSTDQNDWKSVEVFLRDF